MKLRPYQQRVIRQAREQLRSHQSVLVQSPTGSGKTAMSTAGLILPYASRGQRVMFAVHLRDVVDQTVRQLRELGAEPDVIMAGRKRNDDASIMVASVDTLRARGLTPDVDLLIVDEAHRAASSTYTALAKRYPRAQRLGLSATPVRVDGKPLVGPGAPFSAFVQGPQVGELIAGGFLVRSEVFSVAEGDLPRMRVDKRTRDFRASDAAAAMRTRTVAGDPVEHWRRLANGRRTVVFACNRAHGQELAERYNAAGIPTAYVDGNTSWTTREKHLRNLKSGAVLALVNINVFTEGWDEPAVEVVQVVRPTASKAAWIQMVGRGKRPITPGAAAGIRDAGGAVPSKGKMLVIDHGANAHRHGLPDDDRDWLVDASASAATGAPGGTPRIGLPLRTCRACGTLFRAAWCPSCLGRGELVDVLDDLSLTRVLPSHRIVM